MINIINDTYCTYSVRLANSNQFATVSIIKKQKVYT